jgi:hypothetical protein
VFRVFLILALSLPQLAHAHGLNLSLTDGRDAVTGTVTYADGTPLSGASIALQQAARGGAAAEPAVTRTDAEGRYAFPAPRHTGEYRVIADDGLGHRVEVVFVARGDQRRLGTTNTQSAWSRWLSGLGYLAGLFGVTAWWLSRRDRTRIETS